MSMPANAGGGDHVAVVDVPVSGGLDAGSFVQPVQRPSAVVAGPPLSRPAAAYERAGTDAGQQRGRPAGPDPGQVGLVDQLRAGAHPARLDQHVQRGASAQACSACSTSPLAQRTSPPSGAIVVTDQPSSGHCWVHAASTSHGPTASSSSRPVEHQDPDRSHGPHPTLPPPNPLHPRHPRVQSGGIGGCAGGGSPPRVQSRGIGGCAGGGSPHRVGAWRRGGRCAARAARLRPADGAAPGDRGLQPAGLRRHQHGRPRRELGVDQVGDLPPRRRARRHCCPRRWTRRWTG